MSLDDITIDWERGPFAAGQAYVALSRVRSLEGLRQSRALRQSDIKIDPVVRDMMQQLSEGAVFGCWQQAELFLS